MELMWTWNAGDHINEGERDFWPQVAVDDDRPILRNERLVPTPEHDVCDTRSDSHGVGQLSSLLLLGKADCSL